jgi:phytoene dehydrogenase-like protein
MTRSFDAIVIGGGHNGLTCGAYLAKAGKKVLVLEQKPYVGGASVTEEFSPGFRASTYSFIMGHLHPKVIAELELKKHGLEYYPQPNVFNPTEDDGIVFSKDPAKTREQIARFSQHDAESYPKFFERLQSTIEILRMLQLETPVNLFRKDPVGLYKTARLAWKLRNAEKEVYNLLHSLSMSAHDYVSQWFEHDLVKAKFMFWATIGGNVGPYSPGTAFYLVTHLVGQLGMSFAKGGMGGVAEALTKAGNGAWYGNPVRCLGGRDPCLWGPGHRRPAAFGRRDLRKPRDLERQRQAHVSRHGR